MGAPRTKPAYLRLQWTRLSVRHARRAPWTTSALLLIVALGVAVFFSIKLANRAAVTGFQMFTTSISGGADYTLSGPTGTIPLDALPGLRDAFGSLPVTLMPVVEGTASIVGSGEDGDGFDAVQIPVLGVDLLAVRNLLFARDAPTYRPLEGQEVGALTLGVSKEVHVTQSMASRWNLDQGSGLQVILGDQPIELSVASIIVPGPFQAGKEEQLVVMDLPAAKHWMGTPNQVDRLDVLIPEGPQAEALQNRVAPVLDRLKADGWEVTSGTAAKDSAATMTAAFRLNLTLLSLLALIVGLYLILQALEAAVVRRRSEIGVLLAMGFERSWIKKAWLLESVALGVVGSGLGLLLGWIMAQGAVQAVARTVNALYVNTTATAAAWDHSDAWLSFAIGVVTTVVAGWLPARDAAGTSPIQVLRRESRGGGIKLLDRPVIGVTLLVLGFLAARMPAGELSGGTRFPIFGYLAALCWMVAAAILVSNSLHWIPRLFAGMTAERPNWRVTLSQFRMPTGRHRLTVAGLVVAVGMAASMDILIHSFERTVTSWIGHTLRADLFIAVQGVENASNRNRIRETTWKAMASDPDVAFANVGHMYPIGLDGQQTMLVGLRGPEDGLRERYLWLDAPAASISFGDVPGNADVVGVISESFATRFAVKKGAVVQIPTPSGPKTVAVQGVFADYGNERGSIVVQGEQATAWFDDQRAVNFAATLRPGADVETVRSRWMQQFPGLAIRTNAVLRDEVLTIFRQTFSVTHALKSIGIVVAMLGLALALFSLLLDRKSELVTLRELGFTRRDVKKAVTVEGTVLAGLGLLGGMLLSFGLSYVLIFVVNKHSFGWTLGYAVPLGQFLILTAGVLVAAWLTSAGVARWAVQLRAEQTE